jgi:hypothetical protein
MDAILRTSSLLLAIAMIATVSGCTAQTKSDATSRDAMSVIMHRKSVRHFTGEAVSRESLTQILRAAEGSGKMTCNGPALISS